MRNDLEHQTWRILRRIGAVGLMWNRPSDAWLNIWELKAPQRKEAFRRLLDDGRILEVQVEGLKDILYCRGEDLPLIEAVQKDPSIRPRCELLAPLDCLLWDRKLIKSLFHFEYTWEIYTPAHKRCYGFYVLPLLYDDRLAGRVEAVHDRKTHTLLVKNIWYESDTRQTKKLQTAVECCLRRFAAFNQCTTVQTDYR